MRFLDFQQVSTGSPVQDLSYFFYSGASAESLDRLDHYLRIYHRSFSKVLREFGLDPEELYSFNSLKQEWKLKCTFGFTMSLLLWRIKLRDKNCVPDFSDYEFVEVTEPLKIAEEFNNEYKGRIRDLIIHMYDNNFF